MQKTACLIILLVTGLLVQAQQDTTLQQYTGKYKFPDGSVISEMTVTIENGILMAGSVMGNSELKKTEGDVFEVVAYSGTATFRRTEGKIAGVQIIVRDIIMEGTKSESLNIGSRFIQRDKTPPGL